jgi:archaellum component FlaC
MSDDPTKEVPPTQPTLETVLERINALGERLSDEIQTRINALDEKLSGEIHALDEKLSGEIREVRAEVKLINRTFEVVAKDSLEMKVRTREAEARLDELERKAS